MKKYLWIKQQLAEYGVKVAFASTLNKIYFYGIHNDNLAYRINCLKHRAIIKYLETHYKNIIDNYKKIEYHGKNEQPWNAKIWTIWWQGEENAPEHLKMCYNSMRHNSNGHEVVVISKENIEQYISIPEHILRKVESGNISFIHLADFIRMKLLSQYGGMWLDATLFLSDEVPNDIFEYSYFTGKLNRTKMSCVSEGRWNGTFFSGEPNFPFFCFMVDALETYWSEHDQVIDYFLIDYFTQIAYSKLPFFKEALDSVPVNNERIFEMGKLLNDEFNQKVYDEITEETIFHKMQRRNEYMKTTQDGEMTFYGFLCKRYCNDNINRINSL